MIGCGAVPGLLDDRISRLGGALACLSGKLLPLLRPLTLGRRHRAAAFDGLFEIAIVLRADLTRGLRIERQCRHQQYNRYHEECEPHPGRHGESPSAAPGTL